MKKIIFISGTPISKIQGDKINIPWFVERDVEVEYWNLTNIYYHSNHNHSLNSLKLACLTANNIKSSVNSTIHLIPIDPSSQNNTLSLLHFNNQTTIYIEINYIEFNLTHIPKIAGAIKDAIKYS